MTKPIIPWIGGKRRLARHILPLFPAHTCYVEPFCGAAALFFSKPPAKEIADNTAPVSIAITRQLLWRMAGAEHPMIAHRADSRGIQSRGASGDAYEGVTSFLEKRPPNYPNKVSADLPDIWDNWTAPDFE